MNNEMDKLFKNNSSEFSSLEASKNIIILNLKLTVYVKCYVFQQKSISHKLQ